MRENDKTPLSSELERKAARLHLTEVQKHQLQRILAQCYTYVPNPLFQKPGQMRRFLDQAVAVMAATPLDRDAERTVFLQMNYARYRAQEIQRRLHTETRWRRCDIEEILQWDRRQQIARDKIVASNMGLVLSMAKRVRCGGVEFTELISEGSMALLRAVGGYNCDRGFKFSTYACKVILRKYLRILKKQCAYQKVFPVLFDPQKETGDNLEQKRDQNLEDWTQEVQQVFRQNLADLTAVEQAVIRLRFSLDHGDSGAMTLKEVGAQLGLTKERIRQIQLKALAKLREVTEHRMVTA